MTLCSTRIILSLYLSLLRSIPRRSSSLAWIQYLPYALPYSITSLNVSGVAEEHFFKTPTLRWSCFSARLRVGGRGDAFPKISSNDGDLSGCIPWLTLYSFYLAYSIILVPFSKCEGRDNLRAVYVANATE